MLGKSFKTLKSLCHNIRVVQRRELPTKAHKNAWENWQRILMQRTLIFQLVSTVTNMSQWLGGTTKSDISRRFIEQEGTHNKQFTDDYYANFDLAATILSIIGVLIILFSCCKLKVIKVSFVHRMILNTVMQAGLPYVRGDDFLIKQQV